MSVTYEDFDRSQAFKEAKRHSKKVFLLRVILPLCALATFGLYLGSPKVSVPVDGGNISIDKVELSGKLLNPKYEGFDEKNGKYVVKADYALPNFKQTHLITLHKIQANAENTAQGWVRMNAVEGLFNSRQEVLQLTKSIEINTSNGLSAKLKSALVNMKKQVITSKKPVYVVLPNGTVNAGSMKYHTSTSVLNFESDVRVHLKNTKASSAPSKPSSQGLGAMFQDNQEPIDVASRSLEINNKKQTALFRGDVSAKQSDVSLQAKQLQIDYQSNNQGSQALSPTSSDAQKIRQIIARHDVVISTENGQKASAQTSIFDNDQQKVTLLDGVTVSRGGNTLKGNKLVIDLKSRHSSFPPGGRVQGYFVPATQKGKRKKPQVQTASQLPGQQDSLAQSFASFAEESDEPLHITANSLDIYDLKKNAIFRGNVEVNRGSNQIRSGYLKLDYVGSAPVSGGSASAANGPGTQIEKIIARKKVLITTPNNQTVTSDQAVFNVATNIVVIEGNVVLSQQNNVLKGNKLIINLTTGKYNFETGKQRVRAIFTPKNFKVPKQP